MLRAVFIVAGTTLMVSAVLLALSQRENANTAGVEPSTAHGLSGFCPDPSPTGCDLITNPPPTPTPTIPFCDTGHFPNATICPTVETNWGDANCSGQIDPVDSLLTLRHDAGLTTDTGECPRMGADVDVLNASAHIWGDIDCSDAVDPVDGLKTLRYDVGLGVSQSEDCPEVGSDVWMAIITNV